MSAEYFDVTGSGGGGGKSGKGKGGAPQNTMQSDAIAQWVDLISEGPIGGLVTGDAQSIYFNGIPAQNADGTLNFNGFGYSFENGTHTQNVMPGFSSITSEFPGPGQVTHGVQGNYITQASTLDRIIVTIGVQALGKQDPSSGKTSGSSVEFQIQIQTAGGAYVTRVQDVISGETSSPYLRTYDISVTGTAGPYAVRILRLTADSLSALEQNTMIVPSITEVIDHKINYSDSAVAGCVADTAVFGQSIPSRGYLIDGLQIQYPSNYDPVARTYTGLWDGTWLTGVCSNPAWVLYALATNTRWGLSLPQSYIDKYELYQIAQYCDQLVSDGKGGQEPRFTFNGSVSSREDAYKVLQSVASVFRGIMFYGAGAVITRNNQYTTNVWKSFTLANIIGDFAYTSSAKKARHNRAVVKWIDPSLNWVDSYQIYEDRASILTQGVNSIDLTAYGCTSKGQAWRYAAWTILTEQMETQAVTFTTGLDAYDCLPGDIIEIADPQFAVADFAGRVIIEGSTPTYITLDRPVTIPASSSPTLHLTLISGVLEDSYNNLTINRQVVHFSSAVTNTAGTYSALSLTTPVPAGCLGTGDSLVESAAAGVHSESQAFTLTANQPYTHIIEIKAGARSYAFVSVNDSLNNYYGVHVDLTGVHSPVVASAVVSGPGITHASFTVLAVEDGWYRVSITATAQVSGVTFAVNLENTWQNTSYTGDGTSGIYASYMLVVAGSVVADYVGLQTLANTATNSLGITNLALFSQAFDSSTYTCTGLSVTANTVGTPHDPPIMFVLSTTALAPQQYRIAEIEDKGKNTYKITATQYNPAKFALIDGTPTLDINPAMAYSNLPTPTESTAPSYLNVKNVSAISNGLIQTNVNLDWNPTGDTYLKTYMVGIQQGSGNITWSDTQGSTNYNYQSLVPGNYVFFVYAVNRFGLASATISRKIAIGGNNGGVSPASNRTLVYNVATNLGSTTFKGPNAYIAWATYPMSYMLSSASFTSVITPTTSSGTITFDTTTISAPKITVAGTFAAGDSIVVSIANNVVTYNVLGTDTNTSIATALKTLLLADTNNNFVGTTSAANVVTITYANILASSDLTNDGTTDPFFNQFVIKVYDVNTLALIRTDSSLTNSYNYTFEENTADGGPRRSVKISIAVEDTFGNVSNFTSITVNNPAPTAPTTTVVATVTSINFSFTAPSDFDYVGIAVYMSTTNGFTPGTANLVWNGPGQPSIPISPGVTYYYKFCFYDQFGLTGISLSSQYSITAPVVGSAILSSTAVILGTNIVQSNGSTSVTDATAITSLGTAAAITGQGVLATTNSIDYTHVTSGLLAMPYGYAKNLRVQPYNSNGVYATQFTVSGDVAILANAPASTASNSTLYLYRNAFSLLLDETHTVAINGDGLDTGLLDTSGTPVWYYVFLVSDGTALKLVFSLNNIQPAMPTGYTYFLRVSEFVCSSGVGITRAWLYKQFQETVQYISGVDGGASGSYPVLGAGLTAGTGSGSSVKATSVLDLTYFIPVDAYLVSLLLHNVQGGSSIVVAPNSTYDYSTATGNPPFAIDSYSTSGGNTQVDIILEPVSGHTRAIYWGNTSVSNSLHVMGYKRLF